MTAVVENTKKSLTNLCVEGSELKMGYENGRGLGVFLSSGLRGCVEELRRSVQTGTRALPGTAASSPWDVSSGPDLTKAGLKRQSSAVFGVRGMGSAVPEGRRRSRRAPAELPRVPALPGGGGRGARGPLPAGPALSREYGNHVRITCGRSRGPRRGTGREGGTGRDPRSAGRAGPL